MKWWPWRRRRPSASTSEAIAHLARLTERDPEVRALSRDLKHAHTRDNFSDMVSAALGPRPARGGR